jgi:hypothetical protein
MTQCLNQFYTTTFIDDRVVVSHNAIVSLSSVIFFTSGLLVGIWTQSINWLFVLRRNVQHVSLSSKPSDTNAARSSHVSRASSFVFDSNVTATCRLHERFGEAQFGVNTYQNVAINLNIYMQNNMHAREDRGQLNARIVSRDCAFCVFS